jgi:hypothetical protein
LRCSGLQERLNDSHLPGWNGRICIFKEGIQRPPFPFEAWNVLPGLEEGIIFEGPLGGKYWPPSFRLMILSGDSHGLRRFVDVFESRGHRTERLGFKVLPTDVPKACLTSTRRVVVSFQL